MPTVGFSRSLLFAVEDVVRPTHVCIREKIINFSEGLYTVQKLQFVNICLHSKAYINGIGFNEAYHSLLVYTLKLTLMV